MNASLSALSRAATPAPRPLAMVVDITGTSPNYNQGLAKGLAKYPEVVFRTAPYLRDRGGFQDSFLKKDFLGTATWLADRWPAIVSHRRLWKIVQLHGYLAGWRDVFKELRRTRVPVLHIQWCKLPLFDLSMMGRVQKHDVRIVYTVHNALPHGNRDESARRRYRSLYRQADALVVLSRFVGQQVLEQVDDSVGHKINVIEHGILELDCPIPDREVARADLKLEREAEVVLFIGRLSAHKGIADLIDAFAIVSRNRPRLRLIIAGDPQEPFDSYQSQIRRLGIAASVQAHPRFVSEQFKSTLYAAADVAVMPHRNSSQSGMGLEALAAGKPVVATRAGGLVELVDDGVNGYSVPVSDPATMARALSRFFSLSRIAQDAMASASRTLGLERFAWSTIAQRHVDLYRRLAGRAAGFESG